MATAILADRAFSLRETLHKRLRSALSDRGLRVERSRNLATGYTINPQIPNGLDLGIISQRLVLRAEVQHLDPQV